MSPNQKPTKRRDATGHLNLDYERKLRTPSRQRHQQPNPDENAFVSKPFSEEPLAEQRGEAFVEAATSGEGAGSEAADAFDSSEVGDPFVLSPADREFAEGSDESNIPEATREPLPRTSKAEP